MFGFLCPLYKGYIYISLVTFVWRYICLHSVQMTVYNKQQNYYTFYQSFECLTRFYVYYWFYDFMFITLLKFMNNYQSDMFLFTVSNFIL